MDYFWSPNKGHVWSKKGKERKRKKKKRRREIKPKGMETKSFCMEYNFGYGCLTFGWILVVNCMIFVYKLLGYEY